MRVLGKEMHIDEYEEIRESQDKKGNHNALIQHCALGIWHNA